MEKLEDKIIKSKRSDWMISNISNSIIELMKKNIICESWQIEQKIKIKNGSVEKYIFLSKPIYKNTYSEIRNAVQNALLEAKMSYRNEKERYKVIIPGFRLVFFKGNNKGNRYELQEIDLTK